MVAERSATVPDRVHRVGGSVPTSIRGGLAALETLWIVFGALVSLYTLMRSGAVDRINEGFASISEDRRVQIVLFGFFLATFIEDLERLPTGEQSAGSRPYRRNLSRQRRCRSP